MKKSKQTTPKIGRDENRPSPTGDNWPGQAMKKPGVTKSDRKPMAPGTTEETIIPTVR
jgi:hypothetical protein